MQKIILATNSKVRHDIAKQIGLDFEVYPSAYEEKMDKDLSPQEMVLEFAHGKASDVAKKLEEGIVIGADTIVYHEGKKLGKPKTAEEAFSMLKSYSGKYHEVYTGLCVIDVKNKKMVQDFDVTRVKFANLEDYEIKKYVSSGESMTQAGGYGVQGSSFIFIERIDGCYFNVVGLPVNKLYKALKKLGVDIFSFSKWNKKMRE